MELMTLNSSNMGEKLVENYDSLIWSERFNSTPGDFQLKTGDVSTFMDLLPEGQVVTLRESVVPMIVETHLIERKKNQPTVLTIKGRAFDSILDRRVAASGINGSGAEWQIPAKTPSDAAFQAISQICVLGSLDINDIFDPSKVQFAVPVDYNTSTGPIKPFTIPRGALISAVYNLLQTEAVADPTTTPPTPMVIQHGVRAVRPASPGPVTIEIYYGTDKSNSVYFDATRDTLEDSTYLFSTVGSATDAYILGSGNAVKLSSTAVPASSLDRRVVLVDGTSSGIGDIQSLTEQGKTSLTAAHKTAMFDGSINQDLSPYTYGVDYNLGDIVRIAGDYGLYEKARVTEYIRSEDATGTKSYPTLTSLNEG